jgi:hemerythrin-like domain-containing protein
MEFMNRLFHAALRRDLARIQDTLAAKTGHSAQQRKALAEHLNLVLDLLHHHHTGEDEGLWPLVRSRAPDLAAELDMMEAEHAAVAGAITATRAAAARYVGAPSPAADDLPNAVGILRDTLLPHLDHEESKVMPRVMRALSRQDWAALARREVRNRSSFVLAGTGLMWTTDGLDSAQRARFDRQVPAVFRWLIEKRYGAAYRRRTALAFGAAAARSER